MDIVIKPEDLVVKTTDADENTTTEVVFKVITSNGYNTQIHSFDALSIPVGDANYSEDDINTLIEVLFTLMDKDILRHETEWRQRLLTTLRDAIRQRLGIEGR